jgi:hypothetical protein
MLADADEATKAIYSLENASRPEQNKAAVHAALDRAKTWERDTGSPQAQGRQMPEQSAGGQYMFRDGGRW